MERLARLDPENLAAARDAAVAATLVGEILVTRKDRSAAATLRPAVDTLAALVARDPGNAGWAADLAAAQLWLGRARLLPGNPPAPR